MRSGSMKIATPVPSSQSIDRPPEAEGRIQGTSGSLAGPGSARRGCRGSAPAQLLERRCSTPACEPPKRARKMKQAWKNETSSTPVFLRPPPYRARAIPSRGPLRFRRIAVPAGGNERKLGSKHRIQATTNGAQDSSNPYYPHPASRCGEHDAIQHRARSVKSEKSLHCKPSRFARCFSPPSCSPQRLAGVGEYKSDEAHAALVAARLLRADQRRLRFLPLGV